MDVFATLAAPETADSGPSSVWFASVPDEPSPSLAGDSSFQTRAQSAPATEPSSFEPSPFEPSSFTLPVAPPRPSRKPVARRRRRPLFQLTEPNPDDIEERDDAWSLPSWLFSVSFHVVLVVLVASTFLRGGGNPFGRGRGGDGIGEVGEGGAIEATFSTVHVGAGGGGAAGGDEGDEPEPRAVAGNGRGDDEGLSQPPPEVEGPPVELPTAPVGAAPGVGAGLVGQPLEGHALSSIRGNGVADGGVGGEGGRGGGRPGSRGGPGGNGGGRGNGIGDGTAGFFGIRDKTSRVVYVIDRSSSMSNHNALAVAKAELMANLEMLDADQLFQIIFFHEALTELKIDRDRKANLYPPTDGNRTLAAQFISSIHADMGTRRYPALTRALELNPEVIFFLTDVDVEMSAREMDLIHRQAAKQKTRIHVIEFGKGADLTNDNNFLKRLARANGGRYLYRDVLQFGPK